MVVAKQSPARQLLSCAKPCRVRPLLTVALAGGATRSFPPKMAYTYPCGENSPQKVARVINNAFHPQQHHEAGTELVSTLWLVPRVSEMASSNKMSRNLVAFGGLVRSKLRTYLISQTAAPLPTEQCIRRRHIGYIISAVEFATHWVPFPYLDVASAGHGLKGVSETLPSAMPRMQQGNPASQEHILACL